MTEYSRFFDLTAYTEAQYAAVQNSIMTMSGVDLMSPNSGYLLVTQHAGTPNMSVDVAPGGAWLKGAWYSSTAIKVLTVPTAHGTLGRFDRVVLRLTWADNIIETVYVQGTAAASPVAPALTQSASVWEISLAFVYVPANCPAIYTAIATNGSYISSELTSSACGIAAANLGMAYISYQGNLEMSGLLIKGVGAASAAGDACNKAYVDSHSNASGMIAIWSGSIATIPTGYVVCDGSNATPNLVGRFVIGTKTDAGSTYDVGDTGGAATHELIAAELPAHVHTVPGHSGEGASLGLQTAGNASTTANTSSIGSGTAHNNLPPYFALAYIMKT